MYVQLIQTSRSFFFTFYLKIWSIFGNIHLWNRLLNWIKLLCYELCFFVLLTRVVVLQMLLRNNWSDDPCQKNKTRWLFDVQIIIKDCRSKFARCECCLCRNSPLIIRDIFIGIGMNEWKNKTENRCFVCFPSIPPPPQQLKQNLMFDSHFGKQRNTWINIHHYILMRNKIKQNKIWTKKSSTLFFFC